MLIRQARIDDADTIGRYHYRCWIEGYAGLVDQASLDALDPAHFVTRWRRVLAERPPDDTLVAVLDDRVVGHAHLEPPILTSLYVDPCQWGRGYGRALLGAAETTLAGRGVARGELWTIVGNERAIALYRSEGWQPDGTVEHHLSSGGVTTTEMRLLKTLSAATG